MSKIGIIYKSKYGSTRKYALWLAESLKADLIEREDVTEEVIDRYDKIIYGGGVYAGNILGFNSLLKKFHNIKNKDLTVFAVGASPEGDEANRCISEVLKKCDLADIKYFYLRGALDEKQMSFLDKTLMKMLRKSISKKSLEEMQEYEKALVENAGETVDFTDKESINEIVQYINEQSI